MLIPDQNFHFLATSERSTILKKLFKVAEEIIWEILKQVQGQELKLSLYLNYLAWDPFLKVHLMIFEFLYLKNLYHSIKRTFSHLTYVFMGENVHLRLHGRCLETRVYIYDHVILIDWVHFMFFIVIVTLVFIC